MPQYENIAREARLKVLELIYNAQTSHIGSNFSAIDIMTVLFEKADPEKDEVVLSAGWKAAAWYFFLWKKGVITEDELNSFCKEGSAFIGLVEPMNRWGLKVAGGSMGLGLPAAVGMALAKKIKGEEGRIYVLMSDGELQCGTFWESMLLINQHKLDNMTVMVDHNGFCAMGKVSEILAVPGLDDAEDTFDGHDYEAIATALDERTGTDVAVCKTTKGKGVSFFEDNNEWHYRAPEPEEYERALAELTI